MPHCKVVSVARTRHKQQPHRRTQNVPTAACKQFVRHLNDFTVFTTLQQLDKLGGADLRHVSRRDAGPAKGAVHRQPGAVTIIVPLINHRGRTMGAVGTAGVHSCVWLS